MLYIYEQCFYCFVLAALIPDMHISVCIVDIVRIHLQLIQQEKNMHGPDGTQPRHAISRLLCFSVSVISRLYTGEGTQLNICYREEVCGVCLSNIVLYVFVPFQGAGVFLTCILQ